MSKPSTREVTDLCQAINAVEGTNVAPEYMKQNKRICKTLYEYMIGTAKRLRILGVSLKSLDKAILAAGWEDQHFVESGDTLKIVMD